MCVRVLKNILALRCLKSVGFFPSKCYLKLVALFRKTEEARKKEHTHTHLAICAATYFHFAFHVLKTASLYLK